MHIFPRKSKKAANSFYFGEFNESPPPPFSISVAHFDDSFEGEAKHYHQDNQKVYLTLKGRGMINVDGKSVEMSPDEMIHIEPKEVHFIEKVIETPLQIVVILSSKEDDKIIIK